MVRILRDFTTLRVMYALANRFMSIISLREPYYSYLKTWMKRKIDLRFTFHVSSRSNTRTSE